MAKENLKKKATPVVEETEKTTSVVMHGVSGKKIKADIKVVKVKKKAKEENQAENMVLEQEQENSVQEQVIEEKVKVVEKAETLPKTEVLAKTEAREKAETKVKVEASEKTKTSTKVDLSEKTEIKAKVEEEPKPFKEDVQTTETKAETHKEESQEVQAPQTEKTVAAQSETTEQQVLIKPENSSLAATVARFAAMANAKKEAEERKRQQQNRGPREGQAPRREGQGGFRKDGTGQGGFRKDGTAPRREGQGGFRKDGAGQGGFRKEGSSAPFAARPPKADRFGMAPSKDDEDQKPNFAKKVAPKKTNFDEVAPIQKENRKTYANLDKQKSIKEKETNARASFAGKDASRTIKKKATDFARGASEEDDVLEAVYMARKGKVSGKKNALRQENHHIQREVLTSITLPGQLTVKEFAEAIKKTSAEVIKILMKLGVMATLNQEIDFDTAAILASEFGITAERLVEVTEEDILFDDSEDIEENLEQRPPVVVVMGHVDHGKTSLLDRIRQSSVVTGEAGGITQHIGAYMVELNGRKITFLDTPGHEAFTTMRARGAQTTDIAILVVAADDGVMPQTIESINHAKAAGTQVVVAINKIDRPGANIDKVKQELAQHELIAEEWGGSTIMVPVSAKMGDGIEELLEMVLLTADILDLKADPKRQAKGTVIEAKLDKQRGAVATFLVQRGTLKVGDTVVTGHNVGRVRAMIDSNGISHQQAGPSMPVEILGLPEVPEAGEIFYVVSDEKVARQLAEKRRIRHREETIGRSSKMSLENLYSQMASGNVKDLNLIVKADVVGSVEAVKASLEKLSNEEVRVKVVHGGVGAITESDIRLAEVTNAIVVGFNVRPATNVNELAGEAGVDMRLYRVIYAAINDMEAAMKGLLSPTYKEVELGRAEIRQVFKAANIGTIAGSYVLSGKIVRNCEVRLVREGIVIMEGKLASLKRFKDDVKEVAAGYECGMALENYNDIKEKDIIECYVMEEIKRT